MMSDLLHNFDHAALSQYLAAHVDGFETLDTITRFTGGQSNPTYRVTSGTRSFVLRAKPPGRLLPSAHQVAREFRVMTALAETPVPVPKTYHLSDENSPLGAQFFVMEEVPGRIFWDPALPEVSRDERGMIYANMLHTLARLHDVDPQAIGLGDYGKPGDYFSRQLNRWTAQYRAAETGAVPPMDRLIDLLTERLPDDDGAACIVHGDYRLDNLIIGTATPEIVAVLDWELSTLGHPMADLAYLCMGMRLPETGPVRGLKGKDRTTLGVPSESEIVEAYCAHRQIDLPRYWSFYLGFSFFRFAAIIQGVLRRAMDGNAANPGSLDEMKSAVPALAEMGLHAAEGR